MLLLLFTLLYQAYCLHASGLQERALKRGLSDGELRTLRYIEGGIEALDWQPKAHWIHHNEFNIIDAFGLDYDLVHEAREEAMAAQHLTQID